MSSQTFCAVAGAALVVIAVKPQDIEALLGETATTFALIFGLFLFLRHRCLRAFTPSTRWRWS